MMFSTVFSTIGTDIWGSSALLGGIILLAVSAIIAVSSQRWLLWYVVGGIAYFIAVEMTHNLILSWFAFSDWHSYVAALAISWLPLATWVLYRALRYDDVSDALQREREQAKARYIEHTPIYDDHYQPRF
ncbi:AciT family ciprofloxacin tolerance protein [Psychrobacter coccoides]|nr:AciT family ciprofloxacin tolerance protein [Psychrobacter coccoides]